MQNAPARQPRVSPAAPRTGRGWITAASLVVASLVAGLVMVPPFAAGTLFPGRSAGSSAGSPSVAEPVAASRTATETADKPDADVETKYSDLPLAAAPANVPPHRPSSETSATSDVPASGTLATGVFASRAIPEPETAPPGPPGGLTVQPIPPLATPAPPETRSVISPPPARREPLPMQTDLLPAETPNQPPPAAISGPGRHG